MAFVPGSIANKFTGGGGTTTGGFVPGSIASKIITPTSTSIFKPGAISSKYPSVNKDLSSVEGLSSYATSVGLGKQAASIVNPVPKLSFLQRLGKGLGAFNPAEGLLTGIEQKSALAGIGKYASGIALRRTAKNLC